MRDSGHLSSDGFCATSWCGFAQAISITRSRRRRGDKAIPTASYPTPAARPLNSRLSNHKLFTTFG